MPDAARQELRDSAAGTVHPKVHHGASSNQVLDQDPAWGAEGHKVSYKRAGAVGSATELPLL